MTFSDLDTKIRRAANYGVYYVLVAIASYIVLKVIGKISPSSWALLYMLFSLWSITLGTVFLFYAFTIRGYYFLGIREDFAPLTRAARFYMITIGVLFISIELSVARAVLLPEAPEFGSIVSAISGIAFLLYIIGGVRVSITMFRLRNLIEAAYLPLIVCGIWVLLALIGHIATGDGGTFFTWLPVAEAVFALASSYVFWKATK